MDPTSLSDSDGGGGRHRWTPPLSGPRDEGALQPRPPQIPDLHDPGLSSRQPVRSLNQIIVIGSSNEYSEGPTVPAVDKLSPAPGTGGQQESAEERPYNLRNLQSDTDRDSILHLSSGEDSHSSFRTSVGSSSSGHRLLGTEIIRVQPKRVELSSDELKPLHEPRPVQVVQGNGPHKHWDKCEECGRCRCPECVRPRVLPSCWMCGRRCMCSAQSAVDYGTCVCCVKGLFYHCSSDDEDTCADRPFSCSQSHRCIRWSTVSLLALLFPCLLCYLPAKACVSACQCCYDRATRPGCRCKNPKPVRGKDTGKPM